MWPALLRAQSQGSCCLHLARTGCQSASQPGPLALQPGAQLSCLLLEIVQRRLGRDGIEKQPAHLALGAAWRPLQLLAA